MVAYEPETVKGMPEFLPPESQKFEEIKKIIQKKFELYGFLPVKTPTIEFDELMRSENQNNEDEAVSDRFRLQDRGGRNLGLRYEFTFQLSRIFKQNPNIKLPFKRYQIGSVFRDEPVGPGRYREFTQCDIDIIGDSSIEADAECIAVWLDILDELKIKTEIELNNKKLAYAILDSLQISQKKEVLREIDKIDKIGEDNVKSNLKKYIDSNQILTLFKLFEKDLNFFVKNFFDGAEEILKLSELGKHYNFKIKFNPKIVRGLSYYTGNLIELKIEGKKHSIGGGGRYDGLVGKYINRQIPAVGISSSIERLMEQASINILNTKVIVISLEKDKEAIKITRFLRNKGVSAIFSNNKIGKALEYANYYKIDYAIFIGTEEIEKNKFKIKNLKSGEEKYFSQKKLLSFLSNN